MVVSYAERRVVASEAHMAAGMPAELLQVTLPRAAQVGASHLALP